MILIADSGSTKTEWALIQDGQQPRSFFSTGLNPYFAGKEVFDHVFVSEFPDDIRRERVEAVHFYGSGCALDSRAQWVANQLGRYFPMARVDVHSDLLGAARALAGDKAAIICILGTGSASCYYDGQEIVHSVPSLGYVLGDDGSGAAIGKRLIKAYFREQLPLGLKDILANECGLTRENVLEHVYRRPKPNAWLASLTETVHRHSQLPEFRELVADEFRLFFQNEISLYSGFEKVPIGFTGSVAAAFADLLMAVARQFGAGIGGIVARPMDGLLRYHG